jgi:hypothetical protein
VSALLQAVFIALGECRLISPHNAIIERSDSAPRALKAACGYEASLTESDAEGVNGQVSRVFRWRLTAIILKHVRDDGRGKIVRLSLWDHPDQAAKH